jgi:hypothetical protein
MTTEQKTYFVLGYLHRQAEELKQEDAFQDMTVDQVESFLMNMVIKELEKK